MSKPVFAYENIELTDRRQYSTLIDYGFYRMTTIRPKSWLLTVILAHLTKLSLQIPQIATFRAKLRDLVRRVSPPDSSDAASLIQLLEDFDNPEREKIPVVERMKDETFRQHIMNAYLCIFQDAKENHPLPGRSEDESLVNALKIYLMTFFRDSQPVVKCFVSSSVCVTIYDGADFFAVLEHYKEINCEEDDYIYFPFVYDSVNLKEEIKTKVMADTLQGISEILENSDPKAVLNSPETLQVEAVQRDIDFLEKKCESVYSKELELQAVYASVLPKQCAKCKRYDKRKQTFEVLSCRKHYLCRECRSASIECPICPPEIILGEDIELLAGNIPSRSVSSQLESPQHPQRPKCKICEVSFDLVCIGECKDLCTDCWRKYLNTFVHFNSTMDCLICDQSHSIKTLTQKLDLKTEQCGNENCRMLTNSASLYSIPHSRTKCMLCLVCYLLMFKSHPDERVANALIGREHIECLACKTVHSTSNQPDCCREPKPSQPVKSLKCGHKVHTSCKINQQCPVCIGNKVRA